MSTHTILRCLPLLALASVPLAHADEAQSCDEGTIATMAHWAGVKGKLISRDELDGIVAANACKVMPNEPATTIAAVAFDTSFHHRDDRDGDSVQQVVALIEDGKVTAADRSVVEEDARTLFGSYRVDTAPYVLSPTVRAFGVVFHSDANEPSFAEAGAGNELTLWVREGDHLRAVFGTNLDDWVVADNVSAGQVSGMRTASRRT
jgi:hypothetical protein